MSRLDRSSHQNAVPQTGECDWKEKWGHISSDENLVVADSSLSTEQQPGIRGPQPSVLTTENGAGLLCCNGSFGRTVFG